MTIEMTKEEYVGVLKYLLSKPFGLSDFDLLVYAYGWSQATEETLGTTQQLRARVARNATRAHIDEKNPARRQPKRGQVKYKPSIVYQKVREKSRWKQLKS